MRSARRRRAGERGRRPARQSARCSGDGGMVTVEMAAALPVLMVLVLTGVYAVRVVDARVQCLDAAREVARAAARGDNSAAARGRSLAGSSAVVTVSMSADSAIGRVSLAVHPGWSGLPAVTVVETATAAREVRPGVAPAGVRTGQAGVGGAEAPP